jgi:hypothetical protein
LHGIVALAKGKRSHLLAASILVLFFTPQSTRGLCFMPATPMPGSAGQPEHDCCKQGLQALPPACCMTSLAMEAPARIANASRPSAPSIAATLLDPLPVAAVMQCRRLLHFHGPAHLAEPPPLVLRI